MDASAKYFLTAACQSVPLCEGCIFNAPCGVSCQPDVLFRLVAGDSLDKPDGSNGNQVVLVYGLGVIFF